MVRQITKELVANSLDATGITQSDESLFHEALRHILETNELLAIVLEYLDITENLDEMFVDEETPLSDSETIDSDDDISDNHSSK